MFKRDYIKPTKDEIKAEKEFDDVGKGQMVSTPKHFKDKQKITFKYPAIRNFKSLFPNNFLIMKN